MRNKRLSFSLCFILFVAFLLHPSICFAGFDSSLKQTPEGLLVNLAETSYWRHSDNAAWIDGDSGNFPNPSYYYNNQILCSINLEKNNSNGNDVALSVELVSGEWCYVLNGNDARYKRPFGIQIMARGRSGLGDFSTIGWVLSLGGTSNSVSGTFPINSSDASNYSEIIYDVVLVFDNNVDTVNDTVYGADGKTNYSLLATDAYYTATLRLTVRAGNETLSYDLYLNGYYSAEDSQANASLMSSVSVSILSSVKSLVAKDVFAGDETIDIAKYSYATNSIQGRQAGTVSISLSSESSVDSEAFLLRHVNSKGSTAARATSHNSMRFYIYMTSDRGYSSLDRERNTVRFDGSLSYPFGDSSEYLILPASTFINETGTKKLTNWEDSGTISFEIPKVQMINGDFLTYDGLVSGSYTTNIYFNIVTDF